MREVSRIDGELDTKAMGNIKASVDTPKFFNEFRTKMLAYHWCTFRIGLLYIIRIIATISRNLISACRARRPPRAPGRRGPKNEHFTKGCQKELATFGHCPGRGHRGHDHFLQLGQHVSTISLNAPPHRWPTSGQIPIIAGRQCRSPQIHSQASVSLLARPHPLPLLLPARLLLPQFLLLFLLFR